MKTIIFFIVLLFAVIALYNIGLNSQLQNEITTLKASLKSSPDPEKSIPIVAVSSEGQGRLGTLNLRLIPGNGKALVNTKPFTEPDLQYSVQKAVDFAVGKEQINTDFIFSYEAGAELVAGESAGAATTILAIAALENKTIKEDAIITGTIENDGSIGPVDGIAEKAKAASEAGYKYLLVPEGEGTITQHEKRIVEKDTGRGYTIRRVIYEPVTLDIKKYAKDNWNLEIIEVKNIEEAAKYFF